jgi:glycosyltransferase involved in cell wall biosynthesis
MKCRFLYFIGQLRDGGAERQLYYLLQTMDRERYRPQVVVWSFREDEKYVSLIRELGVPIHGLKSTLCKTAKMKWARVFVHRVKPQVVHSYSFYTNFGAWYTGLCSDSLVIGSVRSEFTRSKAEYGFLLGRLCARWPRRQIVNSFAAADSIHNSCGPFVPERVSVVRNGVDLERFRNTPLPNGARPTILGIGTFSRVKRWDRLIRAAAQLKRSGQNFVVKLIGDGPLRHSLEEQARQLELRESFEFVTRTKEIPTVLSASTILAHTSDSEGCPNVVIEAMACGRPVVAMDAGDIPSLVEDGRTGFVVRRGDDATLAARITSLLLDRQLCLSMGQAARMKAEVEFSLKRLTADTLDAYRLAGWRDASL